MMNVSWSLRLTVVGLLAILASCKTPDVEVTALSRTLPSPQLKVGTSSPFDQELNDLGYIRMEGVCDSRVGNISLSFNEGTTWVVAPTTNITESGNEVVALPAGATNDISCKDDGKFDIWLTKFDLSELWGITTGSDGNDVNQILVKGETIIGFTSVLTIIDGTPDGNNKATTVVLTKEWPRGFAGTEQCEALRLSPQTSDGRWASSATAVTVSINKNVGGTDFGNISGYNSRIDCAAGTNATSQFTIPANSGGIEVFYRFPTAASAGAALNSTDAYKFKPVIVSGSLTAQTGTTNVTLRNSATTSWWVDVEGVHRILKNQCTQLTVRVNHYNQSQVPVPSGNVTLSSSDPDLKFYAASDCATEQSTVAFSSANTRTLFVKYTGTGTSPEIISRALTSTGTITATYVDYISRTIEVDRSANTAISKIDIWTDSQIVRGECQPANISVSNSTWTPINVTSDLTVSLGHTGTGVFYSDFQCVGGNEISSTTILQNSSQRQVYYKASPAMPLANSSETLSASTTVNGTPLSSSRSFGLIAKPTALYSGNTAISATTCTALPPVKLIDKMGDYFYANNTGSALTVSYNITFPGSGTVYSTSNCSAGSELSTNGVLTISTGSIGSNLIYVQSNSAGTLSINYTINQNGINSYLLKYHTVDPI